VATVVKKNSEEHIEMLKRAGGMILDTIPELEVKGYLFYEDRADW
jgi:hypothetical protein